MGFNWVFKELNVLKKYAARLWIGLMWLRIRKVTVSYGY